MAFDERTEREGDSGPPETACPATARAGPDRSGPNRSGVARAAGSTYARPAGVAVLLAIALLFDVLGCRGAGVAPVPPVAPRASLAHAEGREALLVQDEARARASFEEAARLAPDWVAPQRALDDLDRAELLGPDLLARRQGELESSGSAAAQYLAGRLEGTAGIAKFQRGIELDPELAWNHHGVAWNLYVGGAPRAALRPGRRALELARDTWEASFFAVALARYHLALGRADRATVLLEERLAAPDVLRVDRPVLQAWLAQAEMALGDPGRIAQGRRRGLMLVAEAPLADADLTRLVATLAQVPRGNPWELDPKPTGEAAVRELATALAARDGALARRLRAGLLFELERPALALALLAQDADEDPRVAYDARLRVARFARGGGRQAIADWIAGLPPFLLDERGAPRDPVLARLALAAAGPDDRELAAALLAAGWFEEAHAFAEDLAGRDADAALALEARASAGLILLDGVAQVLGGIDRGEPHGGALASGSAPRESAEDPSGADLLAALGSDAPAPRFAPPGVIGTIDELLAALEPLFLAYHHAPASPEPRPVDLAASPRVNYGPAATVVHPGPVFSLEDERNGLGTAGAPVEGLAAELASIGRFGIFGAAIGGGGPDGTLLKRVLIEERSGEHLGVPWSGLVAWCDGADVESRPGRRGARISGAALHEGYWVDLDIVRGELVLWQELERRFFGADAPAGAVDRALGVSGARLAQIPGSTVGSLVPLLGQADRVRLAILSERELAPGAASRVTLEELALLTALHEEGHLCDRTRYLPLGKNLAGALRFALDAGLTPGGIAKALEDRAQLVAMCAAPDPRLPLADILSAAELGSTVTPHAAAYRGLLRRWLATLERMARDPELFPALARDRVFAHQLHRLNAEEVRAVSLALAEERGLVED